MPRKLRVEYEGAIYHVMNRRDRREAIFLEDEDRPLFLETQGQACEKTAWQVHTWFLMGNHSHLVGPVNFSDRRRGQLKSFNSRSQVHLISTTS